MVAALTPRSIEGRRYTGPAMTLPAKAPMLHDVLNESMRTSAAHEVRHSDQCAGSDRRVEDTDEDIDTLPRQKIGPDFSSPVIDNFGVFGLR